MLVASHLVLTVFTLGHLVCPYHPQLCQSPPCHGVILCLLLTLNYKLVNNAPCIFEKTLAAADVHMNAG